MKGFREWLRERILLYQLRTSGRTDLLQRLSKPVMATYLSLSVLFFVAYHLGLITGAYMNAIAGGFMISLVALGFILVAHGTSVCGKRFAVFYVGLVITIAVLSILFLTPYYLH
jgi:hypothetical protein